jgi:hypothetical protein
MPDHIIQPRRSWVEKLTSGIKGSAPQVKQGLIVAAVTVAISLFTAIGGCIGAHSENSRLKDKVHDLEQELLPFRNLAVQEFNRADAESMKKLAASMSALRTDYSEQLKRTEALQIEIEHLRTNTVELRTLIPKRRVINDEGAKRILTKLQLAEPRTVGFALMDQQEDTARLFSRLQAIFKMAKFGYVGITQSALWFAIPLPPEKVPHGVTVVVRTKPDGFLLDALNQMFAEIEQAPRIVVASPSADFVEMEVVVAQP